MASRSSLKVVMPKIICWGSSELMDGYDAEEIREAIEAAGLKVTS
jgi:glycine/serine hydroxymethyltransferase